MPWRLRRLWDGSSACAASIGSSARRLAGDLSRRPEPASAGGGPHHRGAAARRRRRGLREDARPHPPRRAPDQRLRGEAAGDPRDHVHEQGRRRDARAARGHARRRRARDLDPHLPRRLRPHPPPRSGPARLPLELHDLRPGRPDPPHEGRPRGARARPEALRPARHPRADLDREEQPRLARGVRPAGLVLLRPDGRRRVRPLPAAALRLERGRLRRHALPHRPSCSRASPRRERSGATPSATSSSTSTRTRTTRSTGCSNSWPKSTRTFSPWAIRTSPSTRSAERTFGTSWSSSTTSRARA